MKQNDSPWIDINDRLPKDFDLVFVTNGGGKYGVDARFEGKWNGAFFGVVKYWCPIPKLPKQ